MYIDIEQVCWLDSYFNTYTTLIVCGWFYTFHGEMDIEKMDETLSMIIDNLENAEEDGAQLKMDNNVAEVMYKNVHQSNLIIN